MTKAGTHGGRGALLLKAKVNVLTPPALDLKCAIEKRRTTEPAAKAS